MQPDRLRKSYPRLKGAAAEVKWILGPVAAVWSKHKRAGNRYDNRVLASLKALLAIRALINESSDDPFMAPCKVTELREDQRIFESLELVCERR